MLHSPVMSVLCLMAARRGKGRPIISVAQANVHGAGAARRQRALREHAD
jgi:hypothetical protein